MLLKKIYLHAAIVICTLMMVAWFSDAKKSAAASATDDASQFVTITDVVPDAILEIRYFSTYNFVGMRIDGYEEPTALLTKQAAAYLMGGLFIALTLISMLASKNVERKFKKYAQIRMEGGDAFVHLCAGR